MRYKSSILFVQIPLLITLSRVALFSQPVYDGNWWLAHKEWERAEFLMGYFDAIIYNNQKESILTQRPDVLEEKITNFYTKQDKALSQLVIPVMFQVYSQDPEPTPSREEIDAGESGDLDGSYWREFNKKARKCFIQGFLEGQKQYGKPEGDFSRDPAWYVDQMSQWYGFQDDDPGEIDPARANFTIAEVLIAVNQAGGATNAQLVRPKTAPSIQKTQPSKKTKRKGKRLTRESRLL